jgi:hypothetical protein
MSGIPRMEARDLVREDVDRVLRAWLSGSARP